MNEMLAKLNKQYAQARTNLIMMVIFTAVNVALFFMNASLYFPFSAFVPQLVTQLGDGIYLETGEVLPLIIAMVISFVFLLLFLLCHLLSKKHGSWIVAALVLFSLDTLIFGCFFVFLMLDEFDASLLIDVAFHAWVLYYLVQGVIAMKKLGKLPAAAAPEQPLPVIMEDTGGTETAVDNAADGGEASSEEEAPGEAEKTAGENTADDGEQWRF